MICFNTHVHVYNNAHPKSKLTRPRSNTETPLWFWFILFIYLFSPFAWKLGKIIPENKLLNMSYQLWAQLTFASFEMDGLEGNSTFRALIIVSSRSIRSWVWSCPKGRLPNNIWYNRIPADQTSTCLPTETMLTSVCTQVEKKNVKVKQFDFC